MMLYVAQVMWWTNLAFAAGVAWALCGGRP